MTPEQDKRVAEIKARLAAATPGDWDSQEWIGNNKLGRVRGPKRTRLPECEGGGEAIPIADAALIAASPSDLAFLLELVEELRAELAEVKGELAEEREYRD